jgi:hypothetical protein
LSVSGQAQKIAAAEKQWRLLMRIELLCAVACATVLAILPVQAADTAQQSAMKTCAANWKSMAAADKAKTTHNEFMSTCLKAPGTTAAAAAPAPAPSMAMTTKSAESSSMAMQEASGGKAKCKDGTIVTYKHRSGTCSGHHGVDTWL